MVFKGHGNKEIVERVMPQSEAKEKIKGLKRISISGRCARECIDIAYGFFTPLEGFMGEENIDAVCERMTLQDGTLWSIPIILDVEGEEIKAKKIKEKDTILLTFSNKPLAILEVKDIFSYNKAKIAKSVLGTTDEKHPGVRMVNGLKDTFIGGKVTLVNPPKFQPPFDK